MFIKRQGTPWTAELRSKLCSAVGLTLHLWIDHQFSLKAQSKSAASLRSYLSKYENLQIKTYFDLPDWITATFLRMGKMLGGMGLRRRRLCLMCHHTYPDLIERVHPTQKCGVLCFVHHAFSWTSHPYKGAVNYYTSTEFSRTKTFNISQWLTFASVLGAAGLRLFCVTLFHWLGRNVHLGTNKLA